jgi:hypothetical protein
MSHGRPLRWSMDEDPEKYIRYNNRVLARPVSRRPTGAPRSSCCSASRERFKDFKFATFDDVTPSLRNLRE